MTVGETYRLDRVKEHSFKKFSQDINIRPQKPAYLMDETLQAVAKNYVPLITEHERKYGHAKIYAALVKVIKENIKRLNRICDDLIDSPVA